MTAPFPPLTVTSIGSVPFLDLDRVLDLIARTCPDLPAWPQLVRLRPREDMVLQAVDGLPLLEADEENRRVLVRIEGREEALTEFYERFLARDLDYFALPPEAGAGLGPFLERARADQGFGPACLKAQVIGPISFGLSVRTPDGKTLLDDPELEDTVVKGLGAKAAWLAREIRAVGRTPLIFFDEPGLTGFGSAFSTLSRERVLGMLNEAAEIARSGGETLIGIHVCGNTDWAMIASADLDMINFDAFGFLDHFLLYPDEIGRFLERGGRLAWGIVPTIDFTGRETAGDLAARLKAGWNDLAGRGPDLELIRTRSLITPACGVGPLDEGRALAVLELLPQIRELLDQ